MSVTQETGTSSRATAPRVTDPAILERLVGASSALDGIHAEEELRRARRAEEGIEGAGIVWGALWGGLSWAALIAGLVLLAAR
jgi:hypothetical protein